VSTEFDFFRLNCYYDPNETLGRIMSFCILRTAKLSTLGNIAASSEHNYRERPTHNADAALTPLNKTHGAQNTEEVLAGITARLGTVPTVRKNAVLALEYFIGASPEWFAAATPKAREAYFDGAEAWLIHRHGAENVVAVTRQYDETSPHICAYVVPIDNRGKLNCSHFQDGRTKLQAMQSEFAEKVGAKHGLQRGVEGSTAQHGTIKQFYAAVSAPTPHPKTRVPKVPEATATEKIQEAMGLKTAHSKAQEVADAAQKTRTQEYKNLREAEAAKAAQFDLLTKERKANTAALAKLRESSVQLRGIDLALVLERLGAMPDPADKNNYRTPVGRVTVTGAKFFNHDENKGGGGAIDLVMQLEQCDYKAAVQRLAAEFGTGAVVSQALVTVKAAIEKAAAAPAPAFVAPAPAPEHWPTVRNYLHQVRKISAELVDALKDKGLLYADRFKNCIFLFTDGAGVELRGTGEQPFHGIRGKKTGFVLRRGDATVKKVAFVESSIDAISLYNLGTFEGRIIATGGNAGAIAKDLAQSHRQDGFEVYGAFDNDKSGDAQAAALGVATRLRPNLKDWNADLVASKSTNGNSAKKLTVKKM
jgi:hypothetical protein